MRVRDPIAFFHHIAWRNWWWAYDKFKDDLEQEAQLCSLLYEKDNERKYRNKCYKHIRRLLAGFGYHEAYGKFEKDIQVETMNQKTWDEQELAALNTIAEMYRRGFDYIKICKFFGQNNMQTWVEVRGLLRKCFSRK